MSLPRVVGSFHAHSHSPLHMSSHSHSGSLSSSPSFPRNLALLPPSPGTAASGGIWPNANQPSAARKLHVHLASSGRYFELAWGGDTPLSGLKEALSGPAAIPPQDQILITDEGAELEHAQPSATPGSAASSTRVFVFDRRDSSAAGARPRPSPANVPSFTALLPSDVDASSSCPLRTVALSSGNPLTRTLPQYETTFCKHVLEARAYLSALTDLHKHASNQRAGQEAVLAALDAALLNLDRHGAHMRRGVETFTSQFETAAREHHTLLDAWPRDLERLREVEVPTKMKRFVGSLAQASPSLDSATTAMAPLVSPLALNPSPPTAAASSAPSPSPSSATRVSLYDVMLPALPLLKQQADICVRDQSTLERKLAEIRTKYAEVDTEVRNLCTGSSTEPAPHRTPAVLAPLQQLSAPLQLLGELLRPAAAGDSSSSSSSSSLFGLLASLNTDYTSVVEYVNKLEESLSRAGPDASQLLERDLPQGLTPMAAVSKFDALNTTHLADQLPKFAAALDQAKQSLLPLLAQSAHAVQTAFYTVQARIAAVSPRVRSVEQGLTLSTVAFERLTSLVRVALMPIHRLPEAWAATLVEVPRRKAFRRAFQQQAQQMADRLHQLAAEESGRRESFGTQHAVHVPKGQPKGRSWTGGFGPLVTALAERPPQLELSFADFDASLPDLDGSTNGGAVTTTPSPSSSSSSSTGMPRSGSNRELSTLPVIDESHASEGSSSVSPTSISAAQACAALAAAAELGALREQLNAQTALLATATSKAATLEAEVLTLKDAHLIAASISPKLAGSPKLSSRRNSGTAPLGTDAAGSNTASPSQSSRSSTGSVATSDLKQRHEALKAQYSACQANYAACQANAAKLEVQLTRLKAETEEERAKILATAEEGASKAKGAFEAALDTETKARSTLEARLATQEHENSEMSLGAARMITEVVRLKTELESAATKHAQATARHLEERESLEACLSVNAGKLALNNFAVLDMVLFYHNKTRLSAAAIGASSSSSSPSSSSLLAASATTSADIDQLEVFNLDAPNYFICPVSAARYKQVLKARQEHADALMAHAAAVSPSPAAAAAIDAAASSSSSSSSSTSTLPLGEFIGQIVELNRFVAESGAGGNPFHLPLGTTYHTVTVLIPDEQREDPQEQKE